MVSEHPRLGIILKEDPFSVDQSFIRVNARLRVPDLEPDIATLPHILPVMDVDGSDYFVGRKLDLTGIGMSLSEQEYLESFFIVDFTPTSENLSGWLYDIVESVMAHLASVHSIEWNETPKSKAVYYG